jgi:hypothetical protein
VKGRRWLLWLAVALFAIGLAQYAFTAQTPAPASPPAAATASPPQPVGTPEQVSGEAAPGEEPSTGAKA